MVSQLIESELEDGRCRQCGKLYENITYHWRTSPSCNHPPLSGTHRDVVVGCLLGDGCMSKFTGNRDSALVMSNNSREFLEFISSKLGRFHRGIYDSSGYASWQLWSRSHPDLAEYREWYGSDGKAFPDKLSLSPLLVKIWYAGDGSLVDNGSGSKYYRIYNCSQSLKKIIGWFQSMGFNPTKQGTSVAFTEDSGFIEWLGEPVPGYEYKWGNRGEKPSL